MAGTRHNLFSSRSCDAMATEPKIPCFVYLFYNFVTGWILEILYLYVRAALGHSQRNQTITTLTSVLALQCLCLTDQGLKQDTSVTVLTYSSHRLPRCGSTAGTWEWPPGAAALEGEMPEHCLAWHTTSCK